MSRPAESDAACMCGEPESTHGWGDPPHMFTPQGDEVGAPARRHRSRCLTCESWGRRHCGEHSDTPILPAETDAPVSRVQAVEAAEDRAEQTAYEVARERRL